MNLIAPNATIETQKQYDLEGIYKQIEMVARTCWASHHLTTDTSWKNFVENLIKQNHTAPLEHGTVYLTIPIGSPMYDPNYVSLTGIVSIFSKNQYSKVVKSNTFNIVAEATTPEIENHIANYGPTTVYYITTNLRVIVENFGGLTDCKYPETVLQPAPDLMNFLTSPTSEHKLRETVHFTCSRAISAEFNRHRKNSPMERSSRYCNFSQDKFGNEITVVPSEWLSKTIVYPHCEGIIDYCKTIAEGKTQDFNVIDYWFFANLACEFSYMNLIHLGAKPEEARDILPMDLRTELYHTAFIEDWEHFFKLRAWKSKGNVPHPEAMKLARGLYDKFVEKGYVSNTLRLDNEIA